MACLSWIWLEQLCIWIVLIWAAISIIRIIVPWLAGLIGMPMVTQILQIVLYAIVAIIAIKIVFMLIGCLFGAGSLGRLF